MIRDCGREFPTMINLGVALSVWSDTFLVTPLDVMLQQFLSNRSRATYSTRPMHCDSNLCVSRYPGVLMHGVHVCVHPGYWYRRFCVFMYFWIVWFRALVCASEALEYSVCMCGCLYEWKSFMLGKMKLCIISHNACLAARNDKINMTPWSNLHDFFII